MCAFIEAVDNYALLLRLSASSAGNDHRLGAHEAPPAIISIYLGSYIEDILFSLYQDHPSIRKDASTVDFTPLTNLAYIPHDNADRNRTSPLAFTGNKFEFRMLGSSMSASFSNTVLNAIMAESLNGIAKQLEGIKYLQDVREKALNICRQMIHDHKRILFSGDGYSEEWVKEAERRGLPNVTSYIEATQVLKDPKVIHLFTSLGIYSEVELEVNRRIMEEQYDRVMDIEVKTLIEMTRKDVLPAMTAELKFYSETAAAAGSACPAFVTKRMNQLSELIDKSYAYVDRMTQLWKDANSCGNDYECGKKIYYSVLPAMEELRALIDRYEEIASRSFYKLPLYEDMIFNLD